jgi:hypothetical protein
MFTHWRKNLFVGLVMGVVMSWAPASQAGTAYAPTRDGGNFGIGLELGDPGDWGITGKLWIDRKNAFQGAVKLGNGTAILQLDYLWHDFGLIRIRHGEMPFYIGVGGDLSLENSAAVAARLPIGLSYIFSKKDVPVDIYLQVVPALWFYGGGSTFRLYPELGAHFYF